MTILTKLKGKKMLKSSYQLYRYALAQILNMTNAKLPMRMEVDSFCDVETPSGKRVDIKACRVRKIAGTGRLARYSLNNNDNKIPMKSRVDLLVCMAYDEELRLVNVLCIPTGQLPDWDTSIGVSISPSKVSRANRWYKYITTLDELKEKLK